MPAPWFWSDQYDVKLQIAGLGTGYDRIVMHRSPGRDGRQGPVSHWYFRGDELLAVDAINDPRSFMAAKRLLVKGTPVDPAQVVNPDVNL